MKTSQLNRDLTDDHGDKRNQLDWWSNLGLFEQPLDAGKHADWPKLASLADGSRSVEDRVRSYLDSNCSHCHGSQKGNKAQWDGRYTTPLADQLLVNGELIGASGPAGAVAVKPGAPELSVVFLRTQTTDPNQRMPPIGRSTLDEAFVPLLEQWIESLP